ncbi:hypothetical protein RHRU231_450173 [Rhodococcus ruber]|uniref:Uncharacterized protein n=1 Tax=Rhodococcus ruber TaxID=1830 RepID=A0A098BMR3_9NOCA|nr:hypothetical protein RHRU231_450173 [Rhodococcus ruber]
MISKIRSVHVPLGDDRERQVTMPLQLRQNRTGSMDVKRRGTMLLDALVPNLVNMVQIARVGGSVRVRAAPRQIAVSAGSLVQFVDVGFEQIEPPIGKLVRVFAVADLSERGPVDLRRCD